MREQLPLCHVYSLDPVIICVILCIIMFMYQRFHIAPFKDVSKVLRTLLPGGSKQLCINTLTTSVY